MKLRSPRLIRSGLVVAALAVPLAVVVGSASAGTRPALPTAGWTQLSWNTDSYKVQN
jgi:hypothetical protein